jgi:glycosyltransferase involved in cell wall biosynthesis
MKIGIIVTTYNRPEYLRQCLESLSRADMPGGTEIVIVDDCSNQETKELITNWSHPEAFTHKWIASERYGIKNSIREGVAILIEMGCTHIINLDGDSLCRNDFISELVKLHEQFPTTFVSGFECTNLNEDGAPRHKIIEQGEGWKKRASAGGINLCFTPEMYRKHIEPILHINDNWDKLATEQTGVICACPSLIQHIGLESSMGHSGQGKEMADVSNTFKPLSLPMVTLIGVDSQIERLHKAANESMENIHYGQVVLLNPDLTSKQAYSDFCIKELYKHVDTTHLLIIQYDGYVKNWKAWDKDWLNYDYIGAPWEWYTDGCQVGNGGFSLRSKRLMEIVATDPLFQTNNHPEDHVICRTHRKYLETQYGIKFAPVEVARKFAIEGYQHWDKTYNGQFGFHGNMVKFNAEHESASGKTAFIQQYFGIGDVIFSMQIARNLQKQGYKICWPVLPDYVEQLNRAYPDITFIDVWLTQPKYMEGKELITRGSTYYVPLRWTYELMKVPFKECMKSKYDFMHMDWITWKDAMYQRDEAKEKALMGELGIIAGEPYTLINRMWKSDGKTKSAFECKTSGKVIEMTMMQNFSLFDWSKIIENATEIHTVSTSIVYILELLDIKCEKVFVYLRKPNENNHDNYQPLMTRHVGKYVFMP